jgi:hypothetical protein
MPWIPEDVMVDIHIIRQDYAEALKAWEAAGTLENATVLSDVSNRRARAIRMVHAEDNASVRHLSGIFRCSKTTIREALAAEEDQE